MGDKNIKVSTQFEHSITNLLGHAPTTEAGIAMRQLVVFLDLYLVGMKMRLRHTLSNRYSPLMIKDKVHTSGPTMLNKYVGS